MEDVAEFPAEHSVAGDRQAVDDCPESLGALLMMGAQDAGWKAVKNNKRRMSGPRHNLTDNLPVKTPTGPAPNPD